MAENLKKFWDHSEQFILTVKGQNDFWNRMFFLLTPGGINNQLLEQLEFKLEKNNWDLETCRESLKISISSL